MKTYQVSLLLITFSLVACNDGKEKIENDKALSVLVDHTMKNMIQVDGDDFLMGDFGTLVGEKIPFSINRDDKQLHKVILDGFMIGKYKVTNKDYNEYIKITAKEHLPLGMGENHPSLLKDDVSVSVTWQQAKDYCLWVGKQTGKKIDLPTEAQWEFAARSRGRYLAYATNDGTFTRGKNVPTFDELNAATDGLYLPIYPVGKYPPSPLGLYDMGLSGSEWTNDWYSSDYYSHSPLKNPKGPESGTKKVLRGNIGGDTQYALTVFRQSALPVPVLKGSKYEEDGIAPSYVFRCVVNN
ncbi:SUMF1/EgtB/PvdO family nonheme iron enzyme [Buttiauxella selenatireducens]|uniref:SUMF1/EgtB/PvdO family nonheme iron enzyme n=1 Tax=Buttiauxella selenatireducens TaxID=3073902 RepID=A0ABY9S6H0_9ENTR|nr:SUMF1/EgtB/PvdO family nonheme iron enzyme [Buttiauxella sp. R73]WMY72555.1 SUMF1/EgtB/PvdO family nonheme iron enzyme [Buttiauxella sp. R73]